MKKMSPKERREAEKAKKQQQFKANDAERERLRKEEEERTRKEKERKISEGRIQKIEDNDPKMAMIKKSNAKAAGVKSTFIINNNKLYMTSFGNGATALPEKYICGTQVSDADVNASLSVTAEQNDLHVKGRSEHAGCVTSPLSSEGSGMDLIRCKGDLERFYFGKEFEDNIHIQLIYQILDIEKLLAVQANNIVFAVDNMLRRNEAEHDDLIGYLGNKQYATFSNGKNQELYQLFLELLSRPQLAYFGDELVLAKGKKATEKEQEDYRKKVYYLLASIGIVRQATAHGHEEARANMYKIDSSNKAFDKELREVLDHLYGSSVRKLNDGFLDKANTDLYLIFDILGIQNDEFKKKEIAREYYEFIVLKKYKTLGFSIKHLRENMISRKAEQIADRKYDSVRPKLNHIFDFMLYLHFSASENKQELDTLIEKLRACQKDSSKEIIYQDEADHIWSIMSDVIERKFLPNMDGDYIGSIKKKITDKKIIVTSKDMIQDVLLTESAYCFCELMYVLTLFLDGKEINDLLTQLITRFDNIQSFLEVMEHENLEACFRPAYEMFRNSKQVATELRAINSFARMSQPNPSAKMEMFVEAAEILGYDDNEEALRNYIGSLLDTKNRPKTAKNKPDNNFRNFIINNVIESDRFKYLCRYGNPNKIRALATNRKVVDFVLKGIPDAQIRAYYNSCTGNDVGYFPKMRDTLADKITGLHFMEFSNVYNDNTSDSRKAIDKERKKNIVRLYLTVLYLLQKNLVYVNSRYFMAFHCVERDAFIYANGRYKKCIADKEWAVFAKEFLTETGYAEKRPTRYDQLMQDFENADTWSIRAFRNCAAHLTAIRNADLYIGDIREFKSYFELYHYLVQRHLKDQFEYDCQKVSQKDSSVTLMSDAQAEGKLLTYFEKVNKYHTYCKDMVKALNVPFSYNLPRFKSLSINELFDRNNYLPKTKCSIGPEDNE